eukprot:gene9966-10121_t
MSLDFHKPGTQTGSGHNTECNSINCLKGIVTRISLPLQFCWMVAAMLMIFSSPAVAAVPQALTPNGAAYYAMVVDTIHNADLAAYDARLGEHQPAAYVVFLDFPFNAGQLQVVEPIISQAGQRTAAVVLTLEPMAGLDAAASPAALADLSARVQRYEAQGASIIVRFAHEMNGSWYPWCQQPGKYKATFRKVAEAVRSKTCKATMLWAPNEGSGYPYLGGQYAIRCSAEAFATPGSDCNQLDTNKDGAITITDDMYTPYYPGDDVVDWVGMSIYHYGAAWPYGANVLPVFNKFADKITGSYVGPEGDSRAVPNFYDMFCVIRQKPMIITETAAFYNTCNLGGRGCQDGTSNAREFAIKQAWWRQVFGDSTAVRFPQIKMINWFDIIKPDVNEAQGNIVDQTISLSAATSAAFFTDVLGVRSPTKSGNSYWQGLSTLNARQTAFPGDNCTPWTAEPDPAPFAGVENRTSGLRLDPVAPSTLIIFVTSLLQAVIGAASYA